MYILKILLFSFSVLFIFKKNEKNKIAEKQSSAYLFVNSWTFLKVYP
jgi:hypothetical protein